MKKPNICYPKYLDIFGLFQCGGDSFCLETKDNVTLERIKKGGRDGGGKKARKEEGRKFSLIQNIMKNYIDSNKIHQCISRIMILKLFHNNVMLHIKHRVHI